MEIKPIYSADILEGKTVTHLIVCEGCNGAVTGGVILGDLTSTYNLAYNREGKQETISTFLVLGDAKESFDLKLKELRKDGAFTRLTQDTPLHQLTYVEADGGYPITGYIGWLQRHPKAQTLEVVTYYGNYPLPSSTALKLSHLPLKQPLQVFLNFTATGIPILSEIGENSGLPPKPGLPEALISYHPHQQTISGTRECYLSLHEATDRTLQLGGYNHIQDIHEFLHEVPKTSDLDRVKFVRVGYTGFNPRTKKLDVTSITPVEEQAHISDGIWQLPPLSRGTGLKTAPKDSASTTHPAPIPVGEDLTDLF
jgi:hypothetical protein